MVYASTAHALAALVMAVKGAMSKCVRGTALTMAAAMMGFVFATLAMVARPALGRCVKAIVTIMASAATAPASVVTAGMVGRAITARARVRCVWAMGNATMALVNVRR